MAANKRIPIKHIRDRAKSNYPEKIKCEICNTKQELELHHYTGLTNLLEKWQKSTGITLDTDEQVLEVRDRFIAEHEYELFQAVVCLCATHHKHLHLVYGKSPLLTSAKKQERWVQIQKDKYSGNTSRHEAVEPKQMVSENGNSGKKQSCTGNDLSSGGVFNRFISGYRPLSSF